MRYLRLIFDYYKFVDTANTRGRNNCYEYIFLFTAVLKYVNVIDKSKPIHAYIKVPVPNLVKILN